MSKNQETVSFVLRLSQKIFENEGGEHHIEWRGNVRHVQSGKESKFTNFEDARDFVQEILTDLTKEAIQDKPEETQTGILTKSVEFWKKMAAQTPKIVIETFKDPKKQAENIQDQISEQFHQIGKKIEDTVNSRIEIDQLIPASKADINEKLDLLLARMDQIELKLNDIQNKK